MAHIVDMERRITELERNPGGDSRALDELRQEIAALRADLAALQGVIGVAEEE